MKSYSESFLVRPVSDLLAYRELISFMVRAELKSKHFRKMLGPLWWILEPTIYAFSFFFITSVVLKYNSGPNYLLFIIISVIAWRWFSRSIDNAPSLLLGYYAVIAQTNLKITPLIYTNAIVELIYFLLGLLVIFAIMPFFGVYPTINVLYLPLIIIIQGTFIMGLSSLIGSTGIFVRDLQQVVWVFTSIWFYLSPGIYPADLIPDQYRMIYELNPFATILPAYRAILLDGAAPDLVRLGAWFPIFLGLWYLGVYKLEKGRGKYYKAL